MSELDIDDMWHELPRKQTPLVSQVEVSDLARELVKDFDYQATGQTEFYPYEMPRLDFDFGIGVIVGASGTGKSTLLDEFGLAVLHQWDDRAIADHFESADEARQKLFAVGLTSVPTWLKPYGVLSNGEKFRADLAVNLRDGAVIDEFTSVVDRNIAKASSKSLQKFVASGGARKIVIATCHRDVLPYLQPDWIIDTDSGTYVTRPRECLHLESLVAEIYEVRTPIWRYFAKHHYLSDNLHKGATSFLAVINGLPAGFVASLRMPHPTILNAWRETRLVVLPDFQGLGFGPRLSNWLADFYVQNGKRYFSQTSHPRLGNYRQVSKLWKPTSMNLKMRGDAKRYEKIAERQKERQVFGHWNLNANRLMFSHEFIGDKDEQK
jgi:GNAT superfamily N-acetyltransferase